MKYKKLHSTAEIIAKSTYIDPFSKEEHTLCTFKIRTPRIIWSEFMTHRAFSRNASSSRAIPFDKQISQYETDIAMPERFGKNQPGMQDCGADYKGSNASGAQIWCQAAESAFIYAKELWSQGYHKQVCNRVIEPYTMIDAIVSFTEGDNFYGLRIDEAADPTIRFLAWSMYEASETATADQIQPGEWHLPFIRREGEHYYAAEGVRLTLDDAIKVSVSMCAQVSYRNSDSSLEKAYKICHMLQGAGAGELIHASPFEHVAQRFTIAQSEIRTEIYQSTLERLKLVYSDADALKLAQSAFFSANFKGFTQKRFSISNECIKKYTG